MGELTARPIQPQVITMPMAVAVILGNASAVRAKVVGKTGAMARPAQNTAIPAPVEPPVYSMANVEAAMATAENIITLMDDTRNKIGDTTARPIKSPRA